MLKYLFVGLLAFSGTTSFSQSKKQVKKTSALARSAFEEGDFLTALLNYQKLDSLIPEEDLINATIAVCYQELDHFEDALTYLDKAIKFGYTFYDQYLIRGKIYHSHHDFDKALENYYLYKKSLDKTSSRYRQEVEEVEQLIQQCKTGFMLKANALVIEVHNLGEEINTQFPEYAPVISSDEEVLFFTSQRPNTTGGKKEYLSGKYFEDIYLSIKEEDEWTKPLNIQNINTNNHDACVGLSANGKTLILYRPNVQNFLGGDLYISHLIDSTDYFSWSTPESLGDNINTNHWEPSACISSDLQTIYFSSNRPGGFGGTDIYRSQLMDNDKWGEAVNMGSQINTKYNEDSPYITPENNVLYFSSKGHDGMGGYDIFMSIDANMTENWSKAKNIGYPINSAKDDLHFSWNSDGTIGYFSSVRYDSYGEHDLYHIIRPKENTHAVYLKGFLTDSITGGPVKNARISLIDKTDNHVITEVFTDSTGHYKIPVEKGNDYELHIESNGYISKDENVTTADESYYYEVAKNLDIKPYSEEAVIESAKSINREEFYEKDKVEEMIVLGKGDHFAIRKVHFTFNKSTFEEDSYGALDELVKYLKYHPDVSLEVSGHTDNIGTHSFNKHLSKQRAQAVIKHLTSQGVSKKRLKAKGYGETKPIASNKNEQGRRLNRRADFKVIKAQEIVEKPQSHTPIVEHDGDTDFLKWKVHFPFNEWEIITEYSQTKVWKIIDFLNQNPYINLKIHAHADPIGSYEYNRALSEKRANTVKSFMIENGISRKRLQIKSFGESYPIIETKSIQHNVKNRRIEFEVIK